MGRGEDSGMEFSGRSSSRWYLSEVDHTVLQTISNEKWPGPSYTK